MSRYRPVVGHWYQDGRSDALFEIVAFDADDGTVQVQYLDGEIADFDLETWGDMVLLPAAAPEDWRPAYEIDQEDSVDPDAALHPVQWGSPVSRIEPETVLGIDDY